MKKTLSIIVPVFNEIKTIKKVIQKLQNLRLINNYKKQIIIVDDHSVDGTTEYLNSYVKKLNGFIVILKKKNKGKGHSQKICKNIAKGDFVVIHDADLEYDPSEYDLLLDPLLEG